MAAREPRDEGDGTGDGTLMTPWPYTPGDPRSHHRCWWCGALADLVCTREHPDYSHTNKRVRRNIDDAT